MKFLLLKQARQTNRAPQITPPLLSCGRLHLTQGKSGNWSQRLPGSKAGALTGRGEGLPCVRHRPSPRRPDAGRTGLCDFLPEAPRAACCAQRARWKSPTLVRGIGDREAVTYPHNPSRSPARFGGTTSFCNREKAGESMTFTLVRAVRGSDLSPPRPSEESPRLSPIPALPRSPAVMDLPYLEEVLHLELGDFPRTIPGDLE